MKTSFKRSDFKRSDRLGELFRRELSSIIQNEVRDPRLPGFITISHIKISPDLSYAHIYFTVLDDEKIADTLKVLKGAAGYIRSHLSKKMDLRVTPKLHFSYDKSEEYSRNLSKLIDKAAPSQDNG
jgi:ribosome-binding factor A